MNKRYIILTPTIYKAAGSQLYTKNKVNFMNDNGWDVLVYSSEQKSNLMIKEFHVFENLILPELSYPPHLFSKKIRMKVLNLFRTVCLNGEKVIIESHTKTLSLWGELIALKYKCKHIAYLLTETFGNPSKNVLDFLNFKHKRKELVGINKKSLELLFTGYKTVKEQEMYSLKAICTNVVEDVESTIIDNIKKKDINIASIGRLDKAYVPYMVDEIISFANKYPLKSIQLILVGDSKDGNIEKEIAKKIKVIKHISLIITGRVFPIPSKLFDKADLFIGVSGSATISASYGMPTIALDVITYKPIGILGVETQNYFFCEASKDIELSEKIDQVIRDYQKYKHSNSFEKKTLITDYNIEFEKHIDFIGESENSLEYYNVVFSNLNLEDKVYYHLLKLLGFKIFSSLTQHELLKKIRKKIMRKKDDK